ncbi:KCTD16 (predicted) [Pycnogonum litorale]
MADVNGDCVGPFPPVVELNVGGIFYTTTLSTLVKDSNSLLGQLFTGKSGEIKLVRDTKGKYFIDRDGVLFRYILDYLRNDKLVLPENFHEKERLRCEADFYEINELVEKLTIDSKLKRNGSSALSPTTTNGNRKPGFIVVGYRGTFGFGRDVQVRKLSRILVCGRISLCREAFGDTLNESRDPDRGTSDRYTARFFLKHVFLEQAFDNLQEAGFRCVASCGSGTSGGPQTTNPDSKSAGINAGMDSEECRWYHYNEFVFQRT